MRYTIAVDFDGVLHSYVQPWVSHEHIPDPPVEGAMAWLTEMSKEFDIVIHSTRASTPEGRMAVLNYLQVNGYHGRIKGITNEKPPALIYLDDRAYRFEGPGTFPTREQVMAARPWNKRD